MRLISLQLDTLDDFDQNLSNLLKYIDDQDENSFILAPELCLTGYAYDRLEVAAAFTLKAIKLLQELSLNKTIALTMTTKKEFDEPIESDAVSDRFSMLGSMILWLFWPSFCAALVPVTAVPQTVVNVVIALCGATLATYITSCILRRKISIADIAKVVVDDSDVNSNENGTEAKDDGQATL